MPSTRARTILTVVVALLGLLSACGGSSPGGDSKTPSQSGSITVAVATPLTDAFKQIGSQFRANNPDAKVTFDFRAGPVLAKDVAGGTAADVFAADEANMKKAIEGGHIAGLPPAFARNPLVIVVPPGNPQGITSLEDLTKAGTVALCNPQTPCGKGTDEILQRAGVDLRADQVSRTLNVAGTLRTVAEGQVDAGIVYASDATALGEKVEIVAIPDDVNSPADYLISAFQTSQDAALADAFIAYVTGPDGQAVLKDHGFTTP